MRGNKFFMLADTFVSNVPNHGFNHQNFERIGNNFHGRSNKSTVRFKDV